ncbi:hypothetical protein D3C83_83700 [compost metagenome]
MLVIEVTDLGEHAPEAGGQPGRQGHRFDPGFFDFNSGITVFDGHRQGERGCELVIDIGGDVDFGLANGESFRRRPRLAAQCKARDAPVVRVLAIAPGASFEDHPQ